jgi:SAM-dependent methyltransferase
MKRPHVTGTDGFLYGTRRKTLAIRHIDDHRVVALLELLSNSNKASPDQLNKLVAKVTDALIHGVHVSIVDPYPPNRHAPRGIHGIIWEELGERAETWPTEKPFTAVAYSSNQEIEAYAQPYGLGDTLPDLPLFLKPDFYVQVPLEQTYMEAFHTMPEYWRERLQEPRKRPNRKIA